MEFFLSQCLKYFADSNMRDGANKKLFPIAHTGQECDVLPMFSVCSFEQLQKDGFVCNFAQTRPVFQVILGIIEGHTQPECPTRCKPQGK
jgi:hypothetical protein